MDEHINPAYQEKKILLEMKKAFKDNKILPSVALHNFLTPEGATEIRNTKMKWTHTTVPDKHSKATCPARLGLQEFVKKITGKKPIPHESLLLRHGDYTLLHDQDRQQSGVLGLYFLSDWKEEWGGDLVFMNDGNMLARFTPKANTLVLVHRKRGMQSFFKYINHKADKNAVVVLSLE